MEAVEEPPLNNPSVEVVKVCVISEEAEVITVASEETDVCHKSNGVADSSKSKGEPPVEPETGISQEENSKSSSKMDNTQDIPKEDSVQKPATSTTETDTTSAQTLQTAVETEGITIIENPSEIVEESSNNVCTEKNINSDEIKMKEIVIESTVDRVTFQTEILVESNDGETIETVCDNSKIEEQDTNNILSELGTDIELSEALRSSDIRDNVENNNCSGRQEVFNKEELLDILEGNDDEQSSKMLTSNFPPMSGDKILEAQLALQQLSRLKTKSKKPRSIERFPRKKRQRIVVQNATTVPEVKDEDNIVKVLVKEWDDDEEKSSKLTEDNETLSQSSNDTLNLQDSASKQDDALVRTSIDSQTTDGTTPGLNKSSDETQPQRRLGRVIKKKVIFDPDNPDTFTKSKVIIKSKDHVQEKDQAQLKKIKPDQTFQRSKSKSPLSKLQWKKPSPKNIKQNKRLTEVDKLLMDEGAVNMIYQLTPEAPKGKKNMKTKAEFIKKIQSSSTPDLKEMKFRERKKESKYDESEARQILGGKQRPSLSSSVKSPCVSEDFEAHSADDSIIYRRHSSSSYSSSCMSPRRLSDVEMSSQISRKPQSLVNHELNNDHQTVEMFIPDGEEVVRMEIINKNDCLSIKEKLNSKLNLALKKRKRENSKPDKPLKQKKVVKSEENFIDIEDFKYLSINIDGKLAVICVQKSGSMSNVEVVTELEKAFEIINNNKDVSVTLLLPEFGSTYSDLDLRTLLDENSDKRTSFAYKMAESIRSLLHTVGQHSKLLCTGVSGRCSGVSLALVGLSDVALASEGATFAVNLKSQSAGPIEPGISVLTSYRHLPESALNDMLVFGRRMSASDALQSGLISRVLWPEKFNEQVLTITKDIAAQPAQNIWLKKQILSLKKSGSESTFPKCLEKERDLFVEYWTSAEGQELLHAIYNGV